jgi:hypothetical protein
MTATSLAYEVDKYSLAQSFYVNEENGIYITKIQLYFQDNGETNTFPVQLEMRPMVNGFPSSATILPGSEVTVKGSAIQVSTAATIPTNFEFDEPIFLNGLTDYCFVVATNTSKYKLFASQGDSFVLGAGATEERISKQQTNGSLFFSQNAATFSAAQDTDLSFKIKRAAFKHQSGVITLKNANLPQKLLTPNPLSVTSGSPVVTVYHPNHGFQPNDFINIHMGGGSVGGLDSSHISGYHKILSSDSDVDYTGFKINVGTNATGTAVGGGSSILTDKNIPYSIAHANIATLQPNSTNFAAAIKATVTQKFGTTNYGSTTPANRYTKDTSLTLLDLNVDNESETPFAILSNSVADSAGISDGSAVIQISLASGDSNVSPMIDLQRCSLTAISYQIDKQAKVPTTGFNVPINYVPESSPNGGSSASKHITNTITLSEDAVGLKIILAANRPSDTDFQMWFRTATTDEVISDKSWILQDEETNNPVDDDLNVFRDYEYLPGGQGGSLSPFTKFQLKIVMRSTNYAKAPTFQSLRVIAMST